MKNKVFDFKIDPKIFENLLDIQHDLPEEATGKHKEDAADAYDSPAGMALLGVKDGKLDKVVELSMSGGCWDAPNINHKDFDKGFRKLLETGHYVVGMALIRHPEWQENDDDSHEYDAKIPSHLRSEIGAMRNSFADITKSMWIVLHNNYFRIYKPYYSEKGRILTRELNIGSLFDEAAEKNSFVKEKIESDARIQKERAEKKRKQAIRRRELEKQRLASIERERELAQKRSDKERAKSQAIKDKLAEGKDSIIPAGDGLSYIKGKDNKYILWQTG